MNLTRNTLPSKPKIVIKKAKGVTLWDQNGSKFLDFCSQTLNLNLGHNHPRIVAATKKQL